MYVTMIYSEMQWICILTYIHTYNQKEQMEMARRRQADTLERSQREMQVRTYVRMYVCMYVCVYVCVCMYSSIIGTL